MKKIKINEYMVQYQFKETLDRVTYNTSVFLVHRNGRGILIDVGYESYAEEITRDLLKSQITIDYIVASHYHIDHMGGCYLFNNTKIIASDQYQKNFITLNKRLSNSLIRPSILVHDTYNFDFHGLPIEIFATPGHTPCSISTLINNEYLHVSDLILEDILGKMIVPYIDVNADPNNHLKSLEFINDLSFNYLLLTHGNVTRKSNSFIMDRIYYLKQFIDHDYNCAIEKCLKGDITNYSMVEIHRLNIRNAKKYIL